VAGLVATFGAGAMTNSIQEIRDADFLLVIGSNTSEAHPIIAMEMKRAVHRGATLVVVDPRAVWMTTISKHHLQIKPGSDVWLLNAMANVIISEGLVADEFVTENTENFELVKAAVKDYTPEAAEAFTGIAPDLLRKVARQYASTPKAGIYYTLGITEHSHGTDNVYALANLVLMTGHLGQPSSGMNPLRGQNNVQGANDAGATPVFYPGYQLVNDPKAQRLFEEAWNCELDPEPGLNLNEMMQTMGEGIKGIFVMGEDIVLSEPNAHHLEAALAGVEFIAIQEPFPNETMRFANVVFPSAVFAEKDGVFTNSERRVQLVRQAVAPPGEARQDWRILSDLAKAVGLDWNYQSPAEIYAEMAALTPQFKGISHERLGEIQADGVTGIQWPCPTSDHPGTVYLHGDGIMRGKGLFQAVTYRPPMEVPDKDYGLFLSTGRTLYHYNAATQTRRESGPVAKQPEAFVEIHPRDARERNIQPGDQVRVSTRRGHIDVIAIVSRQVRPGCIWTPLHFAEARANLLTNDEGDPVTGTAEFKVCAAEVTRLGEGKDLASIFRGNYYSTAGPSQ
jgi:formate dehydrogenase major subunit/formate dehydrogenase alpha subunit